MRRVRARRTGPVPGSADYDRSREEHLAKGDVEICFEDGSSLKAHKSLLMEVSPTMDDMLGGPAPYTFQVDDDPVAWRELLKHYHNRNILTPMPDMTALEIFRVYPLAHKYNMAELLYRCVDTLSHTVSPHFHDIFGQPSLFQWLELSERLPNEDLTELLSGWLEQKRVLSRIRAGLPMHRQQVPQAILTKLSSASGKAWVVPDLSMSGDSEVVHAWCTGTEEFGESSCLLGNLVLSTYSGNKANSVVIWDYQTQSLIGYLDGHTANVTDIATDRFGTNGFALSASYDCSIRLWDVKKRECKATMTDGDEQQFNVCFAGEGKAISSSVKDIKTWDMETCTQLMGNLMGHTDVSCLATGASSAPVVASGSVDGTIRIWDLRTGQCERVMEETPADQGCVDAVTSVAADADVSILLSSRVETGFQSWDVGTGRCMANLDHSSMHHHRVAINSLGTAAVGTFYGDDDRRILTWDLTKGTKTEHRLRAYQATLDMCADVDLSTVAVLSRDINDDDGWEDYEVVDPVQYYMAVWEHDG